MPTRVRNCIIASSTLVAVLLYLDRTCIMQIAASVDFRSEFNMLDSNEGGPARQGYFMSAFFFTYALAQVPAGWLADRFGARGMMTGFVLLWSACTVLTGLAANFAMLIAARLLFGLAQAGCYPTSSSLLKRWVPLKSRGRASSFVAVGGRLGGVIAPLLTAWLLVEYLSWRQVFLLYGLSGLLVAADYWRTIRENPAEHLWCNEEEKALTGTEPAKGPQPFPPLLGLMKSGSMWLMCVLQWGVNIGWVFLITWLPTYLQDVKGVDEKTSGLMGTGVLLVGMIGMLAGGRATDWLVQRLGLRWGRGLPLIATKFVAVLAYLSCLWWESPWAIVAALAVVAFMTDFSSPTTWAYMMDVGGRNAAAVFGWGNMWGNLGAAMTPAIIPWVLDNWDTNKDWHEAFLLCAGGYLIASLAACGINATKKIE